MNAPTLESVIDQAEQLSAAEKLLLAEKMIASVRAGSSTDAPEIPSAKSIVGIFQGDGELWMAEDFDAPLEDSFWEGEDEAYP